MKILVDMDGTIANLYGENEWLADLLSERVRPYSNAKPLCNMQELREEMIRLQAKGYTFEVISWTAKNGKPKYNNRVRSAKVQWIKKYNLPFDKIHVVKYGTNKGLYGNPLTDIIIDDEEQNRNCFNKSINPTTEDIIAILRTF